MTKTTKPPHTQYADVASWELSDSLWERIEPLLPQPKSRYRGRGKNRKHIGGRPAADRRKVMTGILYVLRTGCQWNALPKELGSGKTAHRYFQRGVRAGIFLRMWQAGLTEYDELKGLAWKWQAADGAMTKAPLGGEKTGKNPTDRGKLGTKRSLLVDEQGVPLAIVVSGANIPDGRLLDATLHAVPIERPDPATTEQHLCLDKGYSGEPCARVAEDAGYIVHVPDKANAKKKRKRQPGRRKARRWIVEVAHSWINRFRRLLIRWEKKARNYLALLYFACAIICWRKCEV
jgi:putative transposase